MNTYRVTVYVATAWSFLTKADHFHDYTFESHESLEAFATELAREGFGDGKKWIMPGAILEVKQL